MHSAKWHCRESCTTGASQCNRPTAKRFADNIEEAMTAMRYLFSEAAGIASLMAGKTHNRQQALHSLSTVSRQIVCIRSASRMQGTYCSKDWLSLCAGTLPRNQHEQQIQRVMFSCCSSVNIPQLPGAPEPRWFWLALLPHPPDPSQSGAPLHHTYTCSLPAAAKVWDIWAAQLGTVTDSCLH